MIMVRCRYYHIWDEKWECPLDALPGEEYCYWHKRVSGKEPTEEQLEELMEKGILGVYLHEARLRGANLQKAKLHRANLQEADLSWANLQNANLDSAKLREAILVQTNLHKANLFWANLEGASIMMANLQEANLLNAQLHCATLYGAKFDSQTVLDGSVLIGANLFHSYFDEAKSFRNATVFQNEGGKEINEIIGDTLNSRFIWILENTNKYPAKIISRLTSFVVTKVLNKKLHIHLPLKPSILDMKTIEENTPILVAKLRGKGLSRYDRDGYEIIFFDWSSGCVIGNPETPRRRYRIFIKVEELTDLLLKDGKIQVEFLYKRSRDYPYEASYEVYNNLYNFYTANGRLDQAAHVHYRRGEAHRKLRWARGGWKSWTGLKYKMRSIFDLVILRTFTGYGDKISRPITVSGFIIGLFAFLFWLSDGIVKNVNGTQVAPDWPADFFYHSITTFTSLGYSNIQPNLAVGHLPQILVAAESGLGVLMMALIIFVVTYQVSR
jgi:hypothetical protein